MKAFKENTTLHDTTLCSPSNLTLSPLAVTNLAEATGSLWFPYDMSTIHPASGPLNLLFSPSRLLFLQVSMRLSSYPTQVFTQVPISQQNLFWPPYLKFYPQLLFCFIFSHSTGHLLIYNILFTYLVTCPSPH